MNLEAPYLPLSPREEGFINGFTQQGDTTDVNEVLSARPDFLEGVIDGMRT